MEKFRVDFLSFSLQDPGRILRICRWCRPQAASTLTVRRLNMEKFRDNFLSFVAGPGTNNPNMPLVLVSASFDSTVILRDMERFRVNFLSLSWQDPGRIIRICRWCWPPPASTLPSDSGTWRRASAHTHSPGLHHI